MSSQEAVERAEAYLRAHPDAPLPVSRLSRLVGLSERGLREAFYRVRGMGPKRWMVAARLRGVRAILRNQSAVPTTVTDAAADYGFYELGRFAALYREAFGEAPSETLRSRGRQSTATDRSNEDTQMPLRACQIDRPSNRPVALAGMTRSSPPDADARQRAWPCGAVELLLPSSGGDRRWTENQYLGREGHEHVGAGMIVGRSAAIQRVLDQVCQVAATDSTVLLLGETGTGKELFATQIHEASARRGRAMVRVNCAAIPSALIESELFGREKGAFTGALAKQIGRFEAGGPLDDVPRRDRRPAARRSGEAAAGARGAAARAARQPEACVGQRENHRGDPPQPRGTHCARCIPAGPVLSSQRLSDSGAAAARSDRRHSRCSSGASSTCSRRCSASASIPSRDRAWPRCSNTRGLGTFAN